MINKITKHQIQNKNQTKINKPLSVIDGRKINIKKAFSWVIKFYNPIKNVPEVIPDVIDTTCGEMLMWCDEDKTRFRITTNDYSKLVKSDHNYDVKNIDKKISDKFDIAIYDPPYINLKKRNESKKYENAFKYKSMNSIEQLEETTINASKSINNLLKEKGILIAKITDFHYKNEIRGHHDFINWFSKEFILWDVVIYRFYKKIPNLNFYSKRCAKTHTYFLIFKKRM